MIKVQNGQRQRTTANSQSIIYLSSIKSETLRGHVYSEYYKKILPFRNECELLRGMDDLFDSISFPQASFEGRKFEVKKPKPIIEKVDDAVDEIMNKILNEKPITFVVNVQYRKNATWQGTITWVEQNQTVRFRSALEMLKLMEQASLDGAAPVVNWSGKNSGGSE
ncbi:hypothetical protein [Caproiciproducens faecalis]|uniref:YolD-like protein n=1 Tax=Caproiciproducens faecalis TaxID=2820301 RepID=A0ABS7DKB3_9FIRM|nr:hypothetical protein [Caproiciproducens faecalis]MBW7571722.1 hypothetical protein [Caproiciproducens faecalis]